MKGNIRVACGAALLALSASSLSAQTGGVQATLRTGVAVPSDDSQSNCGHASLAFGVDVQGRRPVFPQFSLDHFSGSGGGDVACLPGLAVGGTAEGGLRLEGATRAGVGVGARAGNRWVQIEAAALGGLISARPGFVAGRENGDRRTMPHVGGQASLVLFRFIVLSASSSWSRMSLTLTPANDGVASTRTYWSPITTGQFGVRFPLSR